MTKNQDWQKILCDIKKIIDKNKSYLSDNTIEAVMQYADHDEYEMAAEGLLLDIMELGRPFSDSEKKDYLDLAISCNLNHEAVFCSDFWKNLKNFCK